MKLRQYPERQIAVQLPLAISARLDALLMRADEADALTSRKELVAAFIATGDDSAEALAASLREYRTAVAADAEVEGFPPEWFAAPSARPGPRQLSLITMSEIAKRGSDFEGKLPLSDGERARVGLSLPIPVDSRLNGLVDVATSHGERTSRRELIAALILAAPTTQQELAGLVARYRSLTPADLGVGQDADGLGGGGGDKDLGRSTSGRPRRAALRRGKAGARRRRKA